MGNAKTIRLLAALLGAQILLALGLAFARPGLSAAAGDMPLLPLKDAHVDRLTIEGPDTNRVTLTKVNGTWRLPALAGFPADSAKVRRLLDRLAALKVGLPAATTPGARTRFQVSDDAFERRITLGAGGKTVAVLYLGTARSTRQVYARAGDKPAVYAVDFATYEALGRPEDWQDDAVLRMPKADIEAMEVAGIRLERAGDTAKGAKAPAADTAAWRATGLAKGEHLKPGAADKLAGLLADLGIGAVLGREEKPEYGLATPALELSLIRKGGQRVEYRLGASTDKSEYTLKVSSRPEYFRLPSYTAAPLAGAARRDSLVAAK